MLSLVNSRLRDGPDHCLKSAMNHLVEKGLEAS